MKKGYSDINISRDFKTSLLHSFVVEKLILEMKSTDFIHPELVDGSTIYFEYHSGLMANRWDTFYGVTFGKINVMPLKDGIRVKYQISILPFRILALAFILFGGVAPIFLLLFIENVQILVCCQIPILALGFAVIS